MSIKLDDLGRGITMDLYIRPEAFPFCSVSKFRGRSSTAANPFASR